MATASKVLVKPPTRIQERVGFFLVNGIVATQFRQPLLAADDAAAMALSPDIAEGSSRIAGSQTLRTQGRALVSATNRRLR